VERFAETLEDLSSIFLWITTPAATAIIAKAINSADMVHGLR
jgi:multisubunit Na+/H+ antiporter MnhG subunit